MTPVQYLSRHVAVSSARRQLYDKVSGVSILTILVKMGEAGSFSLGDAASWLALASSRNLRPTVLSSDPPHEFYRYIVC